MALIRESVAAGHLLKTDPYAYTPTLRPLIDHEWGAGTIAYFTTLWFGGRAILALKLFLAFGTGFACVRCAELRGADFRLWGLCALPAILLAQFGFLATVRAQAYTFFLTAVWLWLLERDRRANLAWDPRWMIVIVALAIFPLWVNVHAGFVVGLGLTGLHLVEQLLRRKPVRHFLWLLGAMLVETLVNPYGVEYFSYLRRALFMPRPFAAEWGPVWDLGTALMAVFIGSLLIAAHSAWVAGWRRAPGILVLAATAVEAMLHRKLLPLFAIAWLCYVPAWTRDTSWGKWWIEFTQRRTRFLTAAWLAAACVCAVAAARQKPWDLAVPQPLYPVGAVQYLQKQKFIGNLMTPFRVGAFISWKLYPRVKVSLDSRYEVAYPDAVVSEVSGFYAASEGWEAKLQDLPTDAVLIPSDAPVLARMPETGWQRVYTDRAFQIYAPTGTLLPVEDWSGASFVGTFP
jgi:hypothetical protein